MRADLAAEKDLWQSLQSSLKDFREDRKALKLAMEHFEAEKEEERQRYVAILEQVEERIALFDLVSAILSMVQ